MAAPEWLAIVEEEIIVRLNPKVLAQIEEDTFGLNRHNRDGDIVYKLNSQELLQVLASSVGIAPSSQGAITIWTYYKDLPDKNGDPVNREAKSESNPSPILRTLMNIDGDLSQKVCLDILQHPLSDRIFKAHSFVVGQISRQFITAIEDYVEAKLRPFAIATISMVTVFTWCEPLRQHFHLSDSLISNCWSIVIAAPITVLIIWWLISKLPFQLPDLPKSFLDIGKWLLVLLESRFLQIVAIAIIVLLILGWLTITFALPINAQLSHIISNLQTYTEPYLPIAIISLRKMIVNLLGKIFLRYSFFVKLIFGRFIK
ncbi:hypothetical protein [Pseudanabaena sp. Chao 1811]|uniref:hypothetical protein n=1 Tax=Pseudanabaena sp. Chao 1811 TaxID=2963092 RepID=UPI0022F38DF7|nr:hypothetical protein [Pseudanabaena sp. Chao 1811]